MRLYVRTNESLVEMVYIDVINVICLILFHIGSLTSKSEKKNSFWSNPNFVCLPNHDISHIFSCAGIHFFLAQSFPLSVFQVKTFPQSSLYAIMQLLIYSFMSIRETLSPGNKTVVSEMLWTNNCIPIILCVFPFERLWRSASFPSCHGTCAI